MPREDVVARALGELLVIVNLRTNQIYELNRTGSRIWQLRTGGASVEDTVSTLAREFAVDRATIETGMATLEQDLTAAGLVEVSDDI